jgi:glycosyltransferase involved in cell wall biosynthesis
VALFTPLPPARTGTADYAASLIPELRKHVDLSIFEAPPPGFHSSRYDAIVYQFANNRWHAPFCELARLHPGIAVLHETKLSHLLDSSGQRGDQFLHGSKAFIVHSHYAASRVRMWGLNRPVAVIPHGVRLYPPRAAAGARIGGIVVGMFGFQGAHKNLAAGLRAFEALAHRDPAATCCVGGDPGGDSVYSGFRDRVRFLGYQTEENFQAALADCDIVVNLRRPPTHGETSGIMMRAFGLGLPVIVSDTGSFQELPDDICCKIPCDRFAQSVLDGCLLRLAVDAPLRRRIGSAARRWAEANCSWGQAAAQYAAVIRSVCHAPANWIDWLSLRLSGTSDPYARAHFERFVRTLQRIPPGGPSASVLEMGCTLHITPALCEVLGYSEIRGCALGPTGESCEHLVERAGNPPFACTLDYFDVERDPFPYPADRFDTVLCCEILEHLQSDPMQMIREVHRILKPGGILVLSTPNAASFAALAAVLHRDHPGFYTTYQRPGANAWLHPRHAREYAPGEIQRLLEESGFAIETLETVPYGSAGGDFPQARQIAAQYGYACDLRDACTMAVARKVRTPGARFPNWLYEE